MLNYKKKGVIISENNIYYVYEHLRRDTGFCVYVGKGHAKRAMVKGRNKIHDAVENNVGIDIRIIKDGLTESQAFELEHKTICHYVFDLGYGIDIDGYRGNDSMKFLTNKTFGGKGFTDMKRPDHAKVMTGKQNSMYGVNLWDTYSEDKASRIKKKISRASKGSRNPMYKIKPIDRMTPEKYAQWLSKTRERLCSQRDSQNPNAKEVIMFDPISGNSFSFGCHKECAQYLIDIGITKSSLNAVSSSIGSACRKNKKYLGLYFQHK